jgi:hypothetical protein
VLSRLNQPVIFGAGISGLYCYALLQEKKLSPLLVSDDAKLGGRILEWGGWNNSLDEIPIPTFLDCSEAQWKKSLLRAKKFLKIKKQSISPFFRQLGFKAKNQSCYTPPKLKKVLQYCRLQSVSISDGRVQNVNLSYKNKKISFKNKKIILCCSPLSTTKILANSELKSSALGSSFHNHLFVTNICLFPETSVVKKSQGYLVDQNITREISGPFPASEIDQSLSGYSYIKLHSLINLASSKKRFISLKTSKVHFPLTRQEKSIIKTEQKKSLMLLKKIKIKNARFFSLEDSYSHQEISHETGGCIMGPSPLKAVASPLGEVFGAKGLFIMDSSLFPEGFSSYPTLPQLAIIDFLLRKQF